MTAPRARPTGFYTERDGVQVPVTVELFSELGMVRHWPQPDCATGAPHFIDRCGCYHDVEMTHGEAVCG